MLTIEEIQKRIENIPLGDPEVAHLKEDDLYTDALQSIANGHPNPRELAKEVLKLADLDFPRWYA